MEHKTGKWICKDTAGDWNYYCYGTGRSWQEYQCSNCKFISEGTRWNYCPQCGTKMVIDDEAD